ncbi:MAG: type II toxin-antitoxin system VapC family toxin [Rhizobiaceae bacterium]|nr:type II toxin-antitoxin system VapC family toxin [Rhizobiaceae bacterium]MCV0406946.1 type II toxin-antitoxin system VapC family toxin [Rhizobiaceae bacterium]
MIVVDTSALVQMYLRQTGFEQLRLRVSASATAILPVSCYVEFALLYRIGSDRMDWLDEQLAEPPLSLIAIEPEHGRLAAEAARHYGKGSGHAAQLNFGDCIAYAVAKHRDLPLLFVGDDFRHTDVIPAIA